MMHKHILIVEDEQKIAALLKEYLEKAGYRATIAGRGDQAVAQARKSSPDLMLLDIMLPGMDGMAVCREVRKFSDIPIIMIIGPITIDEASHQARVSGAALDLTPNEFKLLQVLISQPGRVFPRDELLSRVQGYDCEGYDRTIDSHIKNLRKKIAAHLPGQEIITTVYGLGYKLSYTPQK